MERTVAGVGSQRSGGCVALGHPISVRRFISRNRKDRQVDYGIECTIIISGIHELIFKCSPF